jgi:hypothetical protein
MKIHAGSVLVATSIATSIGYLSRSSNSEDNIEDLDNLVAMASPAKFGNQDEFEAFVHDHIVPLPQAPLPREAHRQLVSILKLAGHHVAKDRGTCQESLMVQLQTGGELTPAQLLAAGIPAGK